MLGPVGVASEPPTGDAGLRASPIMILLNPGCSLGPWGAERKSWGLLDLIPIQVSQYLWEQLLHFLHPRLPEG